MRPLPVAMILILAAAACGATEQPGVRSSEVILQSPPPSTASAISTLAVRELTVLASLNAGTVQSSALSYDSINEGVWVWTSSNEISSLNFVSAKGDVESWPLGTSDQERLPAVQPSVVAAGGRAYVLVNSELLVAGLDQEAPLRYQLPHPSPSAMGQSMGHSAGWNPASSLAVSDEFVAVGYAAGGDVSVARRSGLDSFSTYSVGGPLVGLSLAAFPSNNSFIGGFADLDHESADVILRFDAAGTVSRSDQGDGLHLHAGVDETVLVGAEALQRFHADGLPLAVATEGWASGAGNLLVDGSDPSGLSVEGADEAFIVHGAPGVESVPYPPTTQCGAPSVPNGAESAEICNSRPVSALLDETGCLWALFNPSAGEFVMQVVDLR